MFQKKISYGMDTDHAWDWLTALSPLLVMMVMNYGLSAGVSVTLATVGYMVTTVLWQLLRVLPVHAAPALVCGVLVACCLPATAPAWLPAVAGALGGLVAGVPAFVNSRLQRPRFLCPVYVPALTGYLLVRWLFGRYLAEATTIPAMWTPPDTVSGATPLAAMSEGGVTTQRLPWMFWGFDVGSMGSGPVLAILLGCAFLLLRRRVHPVSSLAMLAVVAVAFLVYLTMPLYGVLAGGTVLAALLLGDGVFVPMGWKGHLTAGLIAGMVTVACRIAFGVDGAAVGLLVACVVTSVLRCAYDKWRLPIEKIIKSQNKG